MESITGLLLQQNRASANLARGESRVNNRGQKTSQDRRECRLNLNPPALTCFMGRVRFPSLALERRNG
jgi:hypothetical protein